MDDRTRLDVEYVENRTAKLDVKILLETFTTVFQDPGDETSV